MNIPSPNYTQSPNVLFDEIFKTLKEGELRIVLVLIRQTFGWHRQWDRISIRMLADKTGMERKSIQRSLKSLIEKGLVEEKRFGVNGYIRVYFRLVMEEIEEEKFEDDEITDEEIDFISNNYYPRPKDAGPASQKNYTGVIKTPTKETVTKEKQFVCVAAPPVAASPLVKNILLKGCDGKDISLSFQDLFDMAIKNRKDWSEKEIDELWKILENYQTPMRDLARFCDGTIKNMRKMKQIKEFNIKEGKCQTTPQNQPKTNQKNTNHASNQSSNIKETISMKDMLVRPFANLNLDSLMPKRFLSS